MLMFWVLPFLHRFAPVQVHSGMSDTGSNLATFPKSWRIFLHRGTDNEQVDGKMMKDVRIRKRGEHRLVILQAVTQTSNLRVSRGMC